MANHNVSFWGVLVLGALAACSEGASCPDPASCPADEMQDLQARIELGGPADLRPGDSPGAGLRVERYSYRSKLGVIQAGTGRQFVVVQFSLSNNTIETPLSLAALLFSLESDRGLAYTADSGLSASVDRPCRFDTAVAQSGSATCELVFDVPIAERPKQLLYILLGPPRSILAAACPAQPTCPDPSPGRYRLGQPSKLVQFGCNLRDGRIFFMGGITLAEFGLTGSEVTMRMEADAMTKMDMGKGTLGCPTLLLAQEDGALPPPTSCTFAQERQTTVEVRMDGTIFTRATLKETLKAGSCLAQPTCTTIWEALWRKD